MGDVKLTSTGGGSVTLTPPSTASNLTLTLPSASGTVATAAGTETLTNKTLTAAGSNSVEATAGPTATQLAGNRNKIINGAMMIDQRNAGASVTISAAGTATAYVLDRFQFQNTVTSGTMTVQQSSTAPTGFSKSVVVTNGAAATASAAQNARFWQPIEGFNFADLNYGTAGAATATLSFWVRSSITGTYAGSLVNESANRSYVFTYTINSANTWEQKTATITGDTTGTWTGATNGIGAYLFFDLGSGSDRNGTASSWAGAYSTRTSGSTNWVGTNGATFYITGVQLEKGATATPFENRLYGTELALCQRYYYKVQASGTLSYFANGNITATTDAQGLTQFPVEMRTRPTALEQSGTASHYLVQYQNTGAVCSSVPIFQSADTWNARTSFTASGLTAGNGCFLRSNNASAYLAWSGEL